MEIPNKKTLEILEERKKYLILKNQKYNNENGYINAEIISLDRIINFTKLFLDNFPNDFLEKVINEYELNNEQKCIKNTNNENEYEIIYTYEKKITKTYKLIISFIKQNKYILVEPKYFAKTSYSWESRGRYRVKAETLEDILTKGKEMKII